MSPPGAVISQFPFINLIGWVKRTEGVEYGLWHRAVCTNDRMGRPVTVVIISSTMTLAAEIELYSETVAAVALPFHPAGTGEFVAESGCGGDGYLGR